VLRTYDRIVGFPWLTRRRKSTPELPLEPPLPLGSRSNGEYFHQQTDHERRIRDLVLRRADEQAQRHGIDRRQFLASSMGMATSLWAINACSGTADPDGMVGGSSTGNGYDTAGSSGDSSSGDMDETGSPGECEPVSPPEFIFDVQTHHVDPGGSWRDTNPVYVELFEGLPQAMCGPDPIGCFSAEQYIELMFIDSDTSVAVLSGIPASLCSTGARICGNPLDNDAIVATRELVNALASTRRSVNHAMVTPNVDLPLQLELMQQAVEELGVGGWKCYPPWGPSGEGFWLDDPAVGLPFIEQAQSLGVRTICAHKGLPMPGFDTVHTDPRDVVAAAAQYPEMQFVVYHSGWLHGGSGPEGPYDPRGVIDPRNPIAYPVDQGVNSLVHAMQQQGLGPGSNVYADLGSVWSNLMVLPDEAAHVLGKLLVHLGEDNVLWGTDCIFTGSPQPLIEAFLAFQISESFQQIYGYPALTMDIKRKILGLNAAPLFDVDPDAVLCEITQDAIAGRRRALDAQLGPRRWTVKRGLGPRTRREYARLIASSDGPG
jgi:uncharacterized protein